MQGKMNFRQAVFLYFLYVELKRRGWQEYDHIMSYCDDILDIVGLPWPCRTTFDEDTTEPQIEWDHLIWPRNFNYLDELLEEGIVKDIYRNSVRAVIKHARIGEIDLWLNHIAMYHEHEVQKMKT